MTAGPPLTALADSFILSLEQRQLSVRTIEAYQRTVTQFTGYLAEHGLPADSEGVDAQHIRAFLAAEAKRTSAVSAHQHYRNLRVLFKWLINEGERSGPDPMSRVQAPKVTAKGKPTLSDDDLAKLLKLAEGHTFEKRRDTAILRILIDSGIRVSGLGGLLIDDVNLRAKTIKAVLKGGGEHLIPLGSKSAAALDRYIRIRARHPRADSLYLWLGASGRDTSHFGSAGIQDMIERYGRDAGLGKIGPHWFRRTFAHNWLNAGGSEADGMRIAGWKTRTMIEHYASELATERARQAHARLSPGDRL